MLSLLLEVVTRQVCEVITTMTSNKNVAWTDVVPGVVMPLARLDAVSCN